MTRSSTASCSYNCHSQPTMSTHRRRRHQGCRGRIPGNIWSAMDKMSYIPPKVCQNCYQIACMLMRDECQLHFPVRPTRPPLMFFHNRWRRRTERNPKHWHQPQIITHWPYPFLLHHRTPEGWDVKLPQCHPSDAITSCKIQEKTDKQNQTVRQRCKELDREAPVDWQSVCPAVAEADLSYGYFSSLSNTHNVTVWTAIFSLMRFFTSQC